MRPASIDITRLLSTKPTAAETHRDADSSDSEGERDFDPEEEDFGGHADGTSADRKKRGTFGGERDDSRAHYSTAPLDTSKRRIPLPIDDEEFMGGKYAGRKTSRTDLGYSKQDEFLQSDQGSLSDDSWSSASTNNSSDSDMEDRLGAATKISHKMREQLAAFREAENAQIEMVARKSMDDAERGRNVREQLKAWQGVLDLRIKIQPLMNMVQRLPCRPLLKALCGDEALEASRGETEVLLETLYEDLESLYRSACGLGDAEGADLGKIDQTQSPLWRDSLDKWHQRVGLAAGDGHSVKRQLKVINQSLWSQVEAAMCDRVRLVQRARVRRSNTVPIGPPDNSNIFDDGDFFQVLVREWIDSGLSSDDVALASGLVVKSVSSHKKIVDSRTSKGRKLRYDVHEKLVNYMVPAHDHSAWPDEKIDAFLSFLFPTTTAIAVEKE